MINESGIKAASPIGTDPEGDPITKTSTSEKVDSAIEDAYWKVNFSKQKYVKPRSQYTNYQPAYRLGYESRNRYPGKRYEEVETELQYDYENSKANAKLGWDKAKHAVRDAWHRVENALAGDAGRGTPPTQSRRKRMISTMD